MSYILYILYISWLQVLFDYRGFRQKLYLKKHENTTWQRYCHNSHHMLHVSHEKVQKKTLPEAQRTQGIASKLEKVFLTESNLK